MREGMYDMRHISIHALREESDTGEMLNASFGITFQSTLSVRRATISPTALWSTISYFNPRSP